MIAQIPLRDKAGNVLAYALVDSADAPRLAEFNWRLLGDPKKRTAYAARYERRNGKFTARLMHREILGTAPKRGVVVDHIDGNGLNNCRGNLRWATPSENIANSKRRVDQQDLKGVTKAARGWQAQIRKNGKNHNLGYFRTAAEAHAAYRGAARILFGRFARFAVLAFGLCMSADAVECWGFPDLRQDDKAEHFAAGFVIGAVTDAIIVSEKIDARWSWWQRDLAVAATVTVVGVAKEVWDDNRGPKRDTADPKDAIATTLGGGFYVCLSHTWRW